MNEEQLEKQLVEILKAKKNLTEEIEKIEHEFTKVLCPKGKLVCEPSYCMFQITDTCPFLTKWRSLVKKYDFSC